MLVLLNKFPYLRFKEYYVDYTDIVTIKAYFCFDNLSPGLQEYVINIARSTLLMYHTKEEEIEKISIYSKHPTLEDVQNLLVVEPMNDIFKMVDAFFSQNGILLLAYYRNFRKLNMQPVAIVALLASQIRFLFQVRVLMDEGKAQATIAQELKANPYRVKLNMQKAMRFSSEALLYNLSLLADFDQQMKMGKIDKDDGFEYFCLNLMMNKE